MYMMWAVGWKKLPYILGNEMLTADFLNVLFILKVVISLGGKKVKTENVCELIFSCIDIFIKRFIE